MAILSYQLSQPGISGVVPNKLYIETNNTLEEILEVGFLNGLAATKVPLSQKMLADVSFIDADNNNVKKASTLGILFSGGNWSLTTSDSSGGAVIPTVANRIAHFINTSGIISSAPADISNLGDITAGGNGIEGAFISRNGGTGRLKMVSSSTGSGDYEVTITNSDVGEDQTIFVPDADDSAGSFLLNVGPSSVSSYEEFMSLSNWQTPSMSDWTFERVVAGEWCRLKTSNDLSTYSIDLTHQIATNAAKGFRLASFQVTFSANTANLVAHSVNLYKVNYIDNSVPVITNVGLNSNTLATASRSNIYVERRFVNSPAFNNTANSKYTLEVTVNNTGSAVYRYFGVNLTFDQTTVTF